MIRVVLADDEQLTRQAVEALLNLEPDIEVVAGVANGAEALVATGKYEPDVLVVDHEMPVLDGLTLLRRLANAHPRIRAVMLTRHARPGVLRQALSYGAEGFLSKTAPASVLADVIRRVHSGLRYVDPDFAADALAEAECPLTERELAVLRLVDDTTKATDSHSGCTSPPGRCATTSPRPWRSSTPAAARRRRGSPATTAGSRRPA